MKQFPAVLACIAVIIASAQAYWTWRTRNQHIESIVAGRQLDACAEVGAAVTDFVFRAQAARDGYSEATFRAVSESPRAIAKASYMAAYLLPQDAAEDVTHMRDLSQRIVAAVAQRQESRANELLQQLDAASARVQTRCREVVERSLFSEQQPLLSLLQR